MSALKRHVVGMEAMLPAVVVYWSVVDLFDRWAVRLAASRGPARERSRFRYALERWLRDLDTSVPLDPAPDARRVLIFCMIQRWVEMCVAIGIVLARRNCSVDVVFIPQYWNRATGEPNLLDRRIFERLIWRPLRAVSHSRLRFLSLPQDVPLGEMPAAFRSRVEEQSKTDVVYIRRRETVDLNGADRPLYEERIAKNTDCARRLYPLLRGGRYDSVLIGNGVVLEAGIAYRTALEAGVTPVTFEGWIQPGTIVASQGALWSNLDTEELWASDAPHVLTADRRATIRELLDRRAEPHRKTSGYTYHLTPAISAEDTRRQLRLESDRPVILICTNISSDSILLARPGALFVSMREWLVRSLEHLAGRDDCEVIVQPHPLEEVGSAEPVAAALALAGLRDAVNIRLLRPKEFNTYSLMGIADVGLVFSSTTGLEMALRGIPVICGNLYHYRRKGFTLDPASIEEYFQLVDDAIAAPRAYRLTGRQVELAWCYADVYFNQLPRRFPWTLDQFRYDEELDSRVPMGAVLSPGGQAEFGRVFDYLAGR